MNTSDDEDEGSAMADGDVLCGASQIAEFLFGDVAQRRRVYHLHERSLLPTFKLGNTLYARRSTIGRYLTNKEK